MADSIPTWKKLCYCGLNIFAASSIVFANKAVFLTYGFKFVTTLTLIHTVFTWVGMRCLSQAGFFQPKTFHQIELAPVALGYVGYIVLNNLSLNLNTVSFYQIMKIAVAPTVICLEFMMFAKTQSGPVVAAVAVVCLGVAIATVSDTVAIKNLVGVAIGLTSTVVTALYQIWAGSKQKELQANSSQLLLAYTPQAMVMLLGLIPMMDDLGLRSAGPNTVLGYDYTFPAVCAIIISAVLGVLVSLSTFLVIGATSSLTYNVVGHFKTVIILTGGCLLFGEAMPWKRLLGVCVTMTGIAWYTKLIMTPSTEAQVEALKKSVPTDEESTKPLLEKGQPS